MPERRQGASVVDLAEPAAGRDPPTPHLGEEEPVVSGRHVGESVSPIFALEGLGAVEILAAVGRNTGPKNVVVSAFDDVDRVDLHVSEVLDRGCGGTGPLAERHSRIQPLSMKPETSGTG